MSFMKKLLLFTATAVAAISMMVVSASACSMIYVGSELTEDGATYFARSEDISNSYNKVFYVSEDGLHKEGETYNGCYGFTWTFTHDSYAYTAFRDDNLGGECPDCGGTHTHMPYEAAGTNSMGVSVTATVTLKGNSAIREADPMRDTGIEEAELTTVILSEAASAREGVELLSEIYATQGASGASGVIIADQNEAWYVENYSGTQYIAIKLPADMIFMSPNMGTLGLIDLDDENVIASENLIATAQTAETFVGDEEKNQIDIRASYSNTSINARMVNGLNYLNSAYTYTTDNITDDVFKVSNVAEDGTVTGFYTDIEADRVITIADMVDFYKVDGIGNTSNLEYHIFQIRPEGNEETATIEWVGMDHGAYGVTIPYYPMLLDDTYEGYQVGSIPSTTFKTELAEGDTGYYPGTSYVRDEDGNRVTIEGYKVLPEGWEDSYYWCFDAVSNYALSDDCSAEMEQLILANYAGLQEAIYEMFDEMEAEIPELAENDNAQARAQATEIGREMAEEAHKTARALYFYGRNGGNPQNVMLADDTVEDTVFVPDGFTYEADTEHGVICFYYEDGLVAVPIVNFTDVDSTDWYADAVRFVAESGLMIGMENNAFAPNVCTDRGMLATILYRIEGCPDVSGLTEPFTDVEDDDWYADAVVWAYSTDIVKGTSETTYSPKVDITREQIAAMLYRYAEYKGDDVSIGENTNLLSYPDAEKISDYAIPAMQWAIDEGLIQGIPADNDTVLLAPKDNATRAQIAEILMRFLTK